MANKGKRILKKQNKDIHINELLAQKRVYSIAKNYQGLLIFISVPLPIIISLLVKTNPTIINESSYIFVLYTIMAGIGEKILTSTIDRLKKIAASIKETFDTIVLDIPVNETLNLVLIDREIIRRYSLKYKENQKIVDKVTDWYSLAIKKVETNVASLLCQRTNITYDFSVRTRYKFLVYVISIITFTILLVIALMNDLSVQGFLIEVVLPSIPVFMFAYKEINSNTESIDNLNHLRSLIETTLAKTNIVDTIDKEHLRNIQDRIYNNRLLSPMIPEFIYNFLRPKLEDEMNYSMEERIKILRITK